MTAKSNDEALGSILGKARDVGFLGPGPVADHIAHAWAFGAALDALVIDGGRFADIGAGGGVPSLPVLARWPELSAVLIDASQKRCSFLAWSIGELGLGDRAEVWCGRAEEIGHEDRARFRFDAVVARGFGPPASTAECGAALLSPGGHLIISEPPRRRLWPNRALNTIGLQYDVETQRFDGVAVFARTGGVADEVPRRAKLQRAKPLFAFAPTGDRAERQ